MYLCGANKVKLYKMRIFLIGYMGSGKTTIGKIVAERLGMDFVDTDGYIENKLGKTVASIFSEFGEDNFRKIERESLLEVAKVDNVIIATGGGAPCFFDNMEKMNALGTTIYINLTPSELAERLGTTNLKERPILVNLENEELEDFIASALAKREVFYNQAQFKVSGSDEEIAEKVVLYIQNKQNS